MAVFVLKMCQFLINFEYKIDHNLKNKNLKIDHSLDSALCASFENQIMYLPKITKDIYLPLVFFWNLEQIFSLYIIWL